MTIKHMKILIEVYQAQNITHAAQRLHMTQPAVTRAIQEIERYYGVCLFERFNKRLYVTESGRQFYTQALHIVESFDLMEKGLRNWDECGLLRLGASITLGNVLMPSLVADFQKKHPHLQIHVRISNSTTLQQMLCVNQLDLAFIEGSVKTPDLTVQPFGTGRLVLILPPDHPLGGMEEIHLQDLIHFPLLVRESGSGGRSFLSHVFAAYGLNIDPVWESTSTQALVQAVHAGLGISILPEQLVQSHIQQGFVITRPISEEGFERKYYIVWHKNKFLTTTAKELIDNCAKLAL